MARIYLNQNLSYLESNSPKGFWPNPTKEGFHRNEKHPWEVPMKRKPRGSRNKFYFDLSEEDIKYFSSGKITTSNKFGLLDPDNIELKEATSRSSGQKMSSPSRKKKEESSPRSSEGVPLYRTGRYSSGNTLHSTYDNFIQSRLNHDCFVDFLNCNNDFMFSDRINFCSGYFPDFITLDSKNAYELSEGNDYSFYYLYTNNNKHLKQLGNCRSKYNSKYFCNMYPAYEISKSQGEMLFTQEGDNLLGELVTGKQLKDLRHISNRDNTLSR